MATIDMGENSGGCCAPCGNSWATSNTMWPVPRSTSVLSGVFIRPPFGHNRHRPKLGGGGRAHFPVSCLVHIEHKIAWAEAYLHTKWHLSPSSCLATTDNGRKLGGCAPLGEGELGHHLTQCRVGRRLPPYQAAS